MTAGLIFLTVTLTAILGSHGVPSTRNVAQFGSLITCATGDSYIGNTLAYNGYGCFCGLGGEGTPLDATDQCCYYHDNCYAVLQSESNSVCPNSLNVYYTMYHYQSYNCGTDQADIICTPAEDYPWGFQQPACAEAVCMCDRAAAQCFAANMDTFNDDYRNWRNSDCV